LDHEIRETARFTTRMEAGALAVKQYQFIYLLKNRIWSLTVSVDETQWETYQPLFDQIGESFQVLK
jgi:hypothetical protein